MTTATFLTRMEGNAPYIPLLDGEDLAYEDGVVDVPRDHTSIEEWIPENLLEDDSIIDIRFGEIDEDGSVLNYKVTRRALETHPHLKGGFMCQSDAPPGAPPDSVVVVLQSTLEMLETIDERLQSEDERFGRIGELSDE
jgi:hypothetical protein